MNGLMTIKGVRGYMDGDVARLNTEDVARGLGFTRVAASGNEVIRWDRVRKYLKEFGVPTSGHDADSQLVGKEGIPEYVPENIFYRLCFKAENETAQQFQSMVCDVVLPAIRKHGAYMTPEKIEEVLLNPDTVINLATRLKKEQEARIKAEKEKMCLEPKALVGEAVSVSAGSVIVGILAKILEKNGYKIGQNRLFAWLRNNGYLGTRGANYNLPKQRYVEMGIFEVVETPVILSDGTTIMKPGVRVTGKGQAYFIKKFLAKENATAGTVTNS